MQVIHHGGKETVTGSCHELRLSDGSAVLIDCGLSQRRDESSPEIDFPVEHIKALILTHVHIDHCGRIPYLLAAGFKGPIYCSEPSAKLLPLMLEDAVKVGITRNRNLVNRFIREVKKLIVPVPYGEWREVAAGGLGLGAGDELKFRLQPAGHILGSAYVEFKLNRLDWLNSSHSLDSSKDSNQLHQLNKSNQLNRKNDLRIIFSGDLGAPYSPLLPAPKSPYRADILVLESTYGNRLHEKRKERREKLRVIIEKALTDLGVILIPAFALGRTQELLYELEEIIHLNRQRFAAKNLPWPELEIIVDSPLAGKFTETFRELRPYWDAEARKRVSFGRHPLSFEQMTTIESHQDHLHTVQYLKKKARPCIVIASSGMCSGGRIVNYLRELLPDKRTDVLFVGYQADGTPGRDIQKYGPRGGYVYFDGQKINIRAGVHTISGYSAHADQRNLVDFVKRMRRKPKVIHLVHGEKEAREALKVKLQARLVRTAFLISSWFFLRAVDGFILSLIKGTLT